LTVEGVRVKVQLLEFWVYSKVGEPPVDSPGETVTTPVRGRLPALFATVMGMETFVVVAVPLRGGVSTSQLELLDAVQLQGALLKFKVRVVLPPPGLQ
jgi:hypothetical protein